MAVESAHIRATCVEATEFMELSRQYRVTGVPKTIVLGRPGPGEGASGPIEMLGALPEDVFVKTALGLSES